jgi:hypothetical protein
MSRRHRVLASSSFVISLTALVAGSALVAACGARGPLDDDGPLDAGSTADVVVAVDAADAQPPPVMDAAPPPTKDAAPEGGSIIACGECLLGKCGSDIFACVRDAACQKTFQCVVTDCLASGGGTPSPACLFKCASGDVKGALEIVQIFTCVTGTCGADCNSLLSGLLGGLGGGGGGGSGDAGKKAAAGKSMPPFAEALSSHWPELCPSPAP